VARDEGVLAYVRAALPTPGARVLEVGAGDGWLTAALRDQGYDAVAIDPRDGEPSPGVLPVALADLDAPDASFDAAVAVVALHHVEPLADSLARLAAVVRSGGLLVVDEFDAARFDARADRWRMGHGAPPAGDHLPDLHDVDALRGALTAAGFALPGEPVRGAYLHRWALPPGLRDEEERLIGAGELPAVGARFVGVRR
jgi:SAM-dependent methyltransferase